MSIEQPSVGDEAPGFQLENHNGDTVRLADYRGEPVVLFFYPKDETEGCTKENLEFSDLSGQFAKLGAVLMGISPDTVQSHRKFIDKHALKTTLLADPQRVVTESYGLWRTKKLYGKKFPGLVRTTFIIDAEGRIVDIIPARRIRDHAQRVLDSLRQHLAAR